jgi:hypothetical protein
MMSTMTDASSVCVLCQACRRQPAVDNVYDEDPSEPYLVCRECAHRLRHRALRPNEWFNLAALHGWSKPPLHDDFYDEDGTASQPELENYATDGMAAPTLAACTGSLQRLTDYCITRWHLGRREFEAFGSFASSAVLAEFASRAHTGNRQIRQTMLELCANVVGSSAAPWVRSQFESARRDDALFAWAEAAAKCLPVPEGLHMTIGALRDFHGRALADRMGALCWFGAPEVLYWIESRVPSQNVTASWGWLASRSNLSWSRIQDWLGSGRPLSLVALDALASYIPRPGRASISAMPDPKLKGCLDISLVKQTLDVYATKDDVPRVTSVCNFIVQHLDQLRFE